MRILSTFVHISNKPIRMCRSNILLEWNRILDLWYVSWHWNCSCSLIIAWMKCLLERELKQCIEKFMSIVSIFTALHLNFSCSFQFVSTDRAVVLDIQGRLKTCNENVPLEPTLICNKPPILRIQAQLSNGNTAQPQTDYLYFILQKHISFNFIFLVSFENLPIPAGS